jgi:hypothetical protein
MRVSNGNVVRAFLKGEEALSHGKNLSSQKGDLVSYTTSVAHLNKAYLAAVKLGDSRWSKGARVPWDQLSAWGLTTDDITSAREDRWGGLLLQVKEEYWLYHPNRLGAPYVWNLYEEMVKYDYARPIYLGTWFKLDRCPDSPLHFARSYLGSVAWGKCLRSDVYWLGDMFLRENDRTTRLEEGDQVHVTMGIWKLRFRRRGEIVTGPFSLSREGHASVQSSAQTAKHSYRVLPTLGDGCVPLNRPIADQHTHQLMEWP